VPQTGHLLGRFVLEGIRAEPSLDLSLRVEQGCKLERRLATTHSNDDRAPPGRWVYRCLSDERHVVSATDELPRMP